MDCLVCFYPIQGKFITCGDPFCIVKVCIECADLLISYSKENTIIPQCPGEKCHGYFLWSEIKGVLSKKTINNYCKACLHCIVKDKGAIAEKANEQKIILDKLRKEREHFLKVSFPPSISKVAMVAFPSKVRRIEKHRADLVTKQLNASNIICRNLSCSGHLDTNMVCMICESKFCKVCEGILDKNHQCNKEDAESTYFIDTLIKCPNCGIAIQKSEGCDSMTCANCDTAFSYNTGDVTVGRGNSHNQKIHVNEQLKLSVVFRDNIQGECLRLLLKFESKQPHNPSENIIITALKKLYNSGENIEHFAEKITRCFDSFMKKKYAAKLYQQTAQQLEKALRKNDITIDLLEKAIENIQ